MEPIEWIKIARIVIGFAWKHRRKLYAAAAALMPFVFTGFLLLVAVLGGGAGQPTEQAALVTPTCQQQMDAQGVDAVDGLQFGPGTINNGKAVIAAGLEMKIPERGIIIALATAMQESGLRNLANPKVPESMSIPNEGIGTDGQSVGIMQQQPWWGAIRDLMTPKIAAQKFFAALLKVGGWQQMAPTAAAQAVQRSAFPDAYADDVPAATMFYRTHLQEVMAAAGPAAETPEDMSGSETDNMCDQAQPEDTQTARSVYNLSQLPPGKASEYRLQRYTILCNRAVSAAFPQIQSIGGYRQDSLHWHPDGLALDIMIPGDVLAAPGVALGNGILKFLIQNSKVLGVDHVIWRQHIYYPSGTVEAMDDLGGITANHFDHVHVATLGGGYP